MSNWRFRRETVADFGLFWGPQCDVDLCGCLGNKNLFFLGKCTKRVYTIVHPQAPVFAKKCLEGSRLKRSAKRPKTTIFWTQKTLCSAVKTPI